MICKPSGFGLGNIELTSCRQGPQVELLCADCKDQAVPASCRCQISGASCKELAIVPEWFEETKKRSFVLHRLVCMSPQVKEARDSILEAQAAKTARWTVQSINGYDL